MSKPPKTDFMKLITGELGPAAQPEEPAQEAPAELVPMPTAPVKAPRTAARKPAANTLKERAHQLSVYLEAPVYNCLRDIAHEERTKLHSLILEAIDMLLKRRGEPSIKELNKRANSL